MNTPIEIAKSLYPFIDFADRCRPEAFYDPHETYPDFFQDEENRLAGARVSVTSSIKVKLRELPLLHDFELMTYVGEAIHHVNEISKGGIGQIRFLPHEQHPDPRQTIRTYRGNPARDFERIPFLKNKRWPATMDCFMSSRPETPDVFDVPTAVLVMAIEFSKE